MTAKRLLSLLDGIKQGAEAKGEAITTAEAVEMAELMIVTPTDDDD